eukprot:SAG22_NODE_12757_length_430_cov_1.084592_1_plen_84_part_10
MFAYSCRTLVRTLLRRTCALEEEQLDKVRQLLVSPRGGRHSFSAVLPLLLVSKPPTFLAVPRTGPAAACLALRRERPEPDNHPL